MTPLAMSVASRHVLGFDSSMLSVFGLTGNLIIRKRKRVELALATR